MSLEQLPIQHLVYT